MSVATESLFQKSATSLRNRLQTARANCETANSLVGQLVSAHLVFQIAHALDASWKMLSGSGGGEMRRKRSRHGAHAAKDNVNLGQKWGE